MPSPAAPTQIAPLASSAIATTSRAGPAVTRPDPQLAASGLEERCELAGGDRGRIERVVAEDDELIAVVAIEPVLRPEPHEATTVLHDGRDDVLGEAVGDREVSERDALLRAE